MIEAVIDQLLATPGVVAVSGQRIRPLIRDPKDVPPCVVVTRVHVAEGITHDGPDGLVSTRFQVASWGKTFLAASRLSRLCRRALVGRRFAHQGFQFQGVFFEDEHDFYEGEAPDRLYQSVLDLRAWHTEP